MICVILHVIILAWVVEYRGVEKTCSQWSVQMRRRSETYGLIVDASHVLQDSIGVLSNPERGAAMFASEQTFRRVAS